jgi:hypothetical protein
VVSVCVSAGLLAVNVLSLQIVVKGGAKSRRAQGTAFPLGPHPNFGSQKCLPDGLTAAVKPLADLHQG